MSGFVDNYDEKGAETFGLVEGTYIKYVQFASEIVCQ